MASPLTMQPATKDIYFRSGNPDFCYAGETDLGIDPLSTNRFNSLISFDFSASVPSSATITLAKLKLYARWVFTSGRTLTAFRLLRGDWVEAQATYNIYKTGSSWGTAGALNSSNDYTESDSATAASVASSAWVEWTVTSQVQTALTSVAGIAHFLLTDMGASAAAENAFVSSDYTSVLEWRPILYIEYTTPWTDPTGINIGDSFKVADWSGSKLNVGDAWKAVRTVKVNIADAWKRVYSSPAVLNEDATYILLENDTDNRIEVE
jgi:hypothetical protein